MHASAEASRLWVNRLPCQKDSLHTTPASATSSARLSFAFVRSNLTQLRTISSGCISSADSNVPTAEGPIVRALVRACKAMRPAVMYLSMKYWTESSAMRRRIPGLQVGKQPLSTRTGIWRTATPSIFAASLTLSPPTARRSSSDLETSIRWNGGVSEFLPYQAARTPVRTRATATG